MQLDNLNDPGVRNHMIEELDLDVAQGSLYVSDRLTPYGTTLYPNLLREAAANHEDAWLASQIGGEACCSPSRLV